jgi:hypothetical protein
MEGRQMFSYLKKLLGDRRPQRPRRAARSESRGRVRPGMEMLEDRLVPAAWAHSAGGLLADAGRAVATDPQGNVYVAGTFQGQAQFGGVTLTSAGDDDAFVAKYSPSGVLQWAQRMGGPLHDEATAIATDGRGNCIGSARTGSLPWRR